MQPVITSALADAPGQNADDREIGRDEPTVPAGLVGRVRAQDAVCGWRLVGGSLTTTAGRSPPSGREGSGLGGAWEQLSLDVVAALRQRRREL